MGKIDMFEHLVNPIDDMNLEASYRLWRVMPYMSLWITEHMVDLLKEKGFWRQALKQNLNDAIKCLKPKSQELIWKLAKEQSEEENFYPIDFETGLCEKFVDSFINYYQKLIEIASVSEAPTNEEKDKLYKKYMVDRAQFIISLEKGDIFSFLDTGKYEEFTYNGFVTQRGETYCEYISKNEKDGPQLYKCSNVYRPVIKMTIV